MNCFIFDSPREEETVAREWGRSVYPVQAPLLGLHCAPLRQIRGGGRGLREPLQWHSLQQEATALMGSRSLAWLRRKQHPWPPALLRKGQSKAICLWRKTHAQSSRIQIVRKRFTVLRKGWKQKPSDPGERQ